MFELQRYFRFASTVNPIRRKGCRRKRLTCCKPHTKYSDTEGSDFSYYQVSQNFWLAFFHGRFKMAVAGRTYCD